MYEEKSKIRYRVKKSNPSLREYFLPWGLLGLLLILLPLLFALLWFAKNGIQNTVQTEVKNELVSQNLDWVNVDVDGQIVTLSGSGPKADGDRAISLAEQVKNKAWFGRFAVPARVQGEFTESAPVVVEPVVEEVVAQELVWGRLEGTLQSGVLTITGTVDSLEEKQTLLDAANDRIAPPKLTSVVDELVVSEQRLIPVSSNLANRVVQFLSTCNSGQSSSIDGVFSINCQASRDLVADLNRLASTPIDGAELGSIVISSTDECNQSFASILEGKSIAFAVSSANLETSSNTLLDEISELAKSCPGTIRVEGHTDATGQLEANMALSEARAAAVVEALVSRGVERERLTPEGLGPTQPRAEGKSLQAHALNRRIEFHVSD